MAFDMKPLPYFRLARGVSYFCELLARVDPDPDHAFTGIHMENAF